MEQMKSYVNWRRCLKMKKNDEKAVKINGFEGDVQKIADELAVLLMRKHRDYGPKNISQSPGGPLNGLRVRMWDKMARINNLLDKPSSKPMYEPLEDSFMDMANYAIIGLMVQRVLWPND